MDGEITNEVDGLWIVVGLEDLRDGDGQYVSRSRLYGTLAAAIRDAERRVSSCPNRKYGIFELTDIIASECVIAKRATVTPEIAKEWIAAQ